MARGVNKVILIGNLGGDPEVRYTPGGAAVANVNLATSESWTDKQSGEKRENTEWHRLIFWNKLAEIVGQYLKKGSKIFVEGRLQTRQWDDQSGQKRYTTEIVVTDMQMLDGRGDGGMGGGGTGGGGMGPGQAGPPQGGGDFGQGGGGGGYGPPPGDGQSAGGGQQAGGGQPTGGGTPAGGVAEEDDLPF